MSGPGDDVDDAGDPSIPAEADPEVVERIRGYAEFHPRADAVDVLAQLLVDPDVYKPVAEAAVAGELPENPGTEADSTRSNPGGSVDTNGSAPTFEGESEPDKSAAGDAPENLDNETDTGDGDGAGDDVDGGNGVTYTDKKINRGICTRGQDAPEAGDAVDVDDLPAAPEIDADTYPVDLQDVPRWLTWKPTDDGRKVPRAPYANPDWPDKFVSAQDPEVWVDFDTAAEWADRLPGYGLAFNIPNRDADVDDDHVLIDYDDARDPSTEEIHPTVREHIQRAGSYADVSTSGTGVHIFARGSLPDGVKAIDAPLPDAEGFDDAEIEVYDAGRYSAMTGDHIQGTPTRTTDCQAFLEDLADNYATVAEGTPDELTREPEKSRDELADVETTTDLQDVFDAIQHVGPRDVRLRSTVTEERADGSKSMDPSWATSKSGTRLAQVDDGWVYRKGMYGLDALQVVALEERIISRVDDYPTGDDFWDAVDALRDRGAHIPEYEHAGDGEPTVALPDVDDLQDAVNGWDWRNAARDGQRDLSIDDARDRTREAIADAYDRHDHVLIEALPTMGKSYGAVAAAADTDTPITVLTGRGRKEQYDQFREWADARGLSYYTLPSFARDCPTAAGEHGDEWADRVRDWYRRGATPQEIHKAAEYVLGRPLPCQEHDGHTCPYAAKWEFDPDDYDVLIGHYTHAYKPKVTTGRTVVFDEFPGGAYETELGFELAGAVSYFLETTDALPFDDYTDLLEHRDDVDRRADALAWFQDQDLEPDETQVFDDDSAHAAAPLAVFTILAGAADDLENGWERADLEDAGVGAFDRANGRVHLLRPPALEYASGVVALDGTPTVDMWELALGERLNHRQVLADGERADYLRDVLNLNLIRTTDAVKPYNSPDHVAVDQDAALLEAIRDAHGERPGLITTLTAEHEYDGADADVLAFVDDTQHYGNVLGSNQFGETRLGAVIGSNHYGDGYIKKWGAFAGEAVARGDDRGAGLSYGAFGDRILTHMREHNTLQAAMRFGRDGNGAVVYVHTDTLPEWVPVAGEGRVIQTWSDGMRQVVDALQDLGTARTAEIAAHPDVDVGQRQVFDHLETLRDRGHLARQQDPDDGRAYRWSDDGLHRVNDHGDVELEPVDVDDLADGEVAELARRTTYTWEFRNRTGRDGSKPPDGAERAATDGGSVVDDVDHGGPPPG